MKKILSSILALGLVMGIGTSALAKNIDTKAEALVLIDQTNSEINSKIVNAQGEAKELQDEYILNIKSLYKDASFSIANKTNTSDSTIDSIKVITDEMEQKIIDAQVADTPDHLSVVEDEINEIDALLAPVQEGFLVGNLDNQSKEKYDKLTKEYAKKLDKIISNLYKETLRMSQHTIKKADKVGIQAICTWVTVEIGGRWVDIDPIAVVGEN